MVTLCAVGLVASVTVKLTVKGPVTVGVPVMAPVLEMVSPAGRPLADQLRGVFPPVAARVVLYAALSTPSGNELVVIDKAGAMFNVSGLVAVSGVVLESVAVTLTVKVPLTVGVPVMAPLLEAMLRPDGSPVALQAIGLLPPVEVKAPLLYATPM